MFVRLFSAENKILMDSSADSSNPFVGLAFKLEVMEIYDFYALVQCIKGLTLLIATSVIIIAVKILTILYVSYVFYP